MSSFHDSRGSWTTSCSRRPQLWLLKHLLVEHSKRSFSNVGSRQQSSSGRQDHVGRGREAGFPPEFCLWNLVGKYSRQLERAGSEEEEDRRKGR